MECFIVENGVERKAELEDILPLIDDMGIQHVFRDAYRLGICLPDVLAHIPDEIKNLVYRNLLTRMRRGIERKVLDVESKYKKDDYGLRDQRARLIHLIEKSTYKASGRIVWKKAEHKKEPPKNEPPNLIEELTKKIKEACNSGKLDLSYITDNISEDDVQNIFAKFQDQKNELQKIRILSTYADIIPVTAPLFEAGGIEKLEINGLFSGTWPEFIEKYQPLTSLDINAWDGLTEFPSWVRNAVSLRHLSISIPNPTFLPDWIGEMQSLTELIINCDKMKTIPDSIGNLKNLAKLYIDCSSIEKLPDSMGNLKNLTVLSLYGSKLERLPDWIGNLDNLDELSLGGNKNLKYLPDSVGKLKNLTTLYLCGSALKKLPDAMANCSSLECVDIRNTRIISLPDFIFSIKTLIQSVYAIPKEHSITYRSFCNSYYTLVKTIIRFQKKAWREGILALEEELDDISKDFLGEGLRFVVNGTDGEIIQHTLTLKIERESNYYKKKLTEIAMEGILCISRRDCISDTCIKLAVMADIKNNPLDAACAKYMAGDYEALNHIDFNAAILHEKEREEIRFIKRALEISEISRRKGHFGIEEHLDSGGIAARDVFEYGLSLIVEGWSRQATDKVLTMLISYENDPVRKNLALAKKEAIKMIYDGDNPWQLKPYLSAYFDDDIVMDFLSEQEE